MKIFSGQFYNQIVVTILIMHGILLADSQKPSSTLPAYKNVISEISYSVDSDNQIAIIFACQQNPICMYTPLKYQDMDEASLVKTYYLPCMSYTPAQLYYLSHDVAKFLEKIGINLEIEEIKDNRSFLHFAPKNCGLRISFMMQPGVFYDITKTIDCEKKLVLFHFFEKI